MNITVTSDQILALTGAALGAGVAAAIGLVYTARWFAIKQIRTSHER